MELKIRGVVIEKDGDYYKVTTIKGQEFCFNPVTWEFVGDIRPSKKMLKYLCREIDRKHFILNPSCSRRARRPEGFLPSIEPFIEITTLAKAC